MSVTLLHPDHTAAPTRWVPHRAGIENVWRYYGEVFEFHNGRLLLRGANGSGKSKALELLLPFLFDASLRAQRLSTFGTSERTMHWNLMGEGTDNKTRVGYVWVEFAGSAGTGPNTPRRYFTCGARLQATVHRSSADADFFTLGRAVSPGEFTTTDGRPLTVAGLRERLGHDGTVHDSAGDYRAEIRSVLFGGITEQRYDSLVLALLQLRTPKLSQRLDPSLLSTLLSRALPPLGESELGELAEGFQRLDRQREEVERLDDEAATARSLATAQQTYARRVIRAAAAELITATSVMDGHTRTVRENEEELAAARLAHGRAHSDGAAARTQVERVAIEVEELQARSEYQEGAAALRRIADLQRQLRSAEKHRTEAAARAAAAESHAHDDDESARCAAEELGSVSARAAELDEAAADRAARAGMLSVHAEMLAPAGADRRRAEALLGAAVTGRLGQIDEVRTALREHERVIDRRGHVENLVEQSREILEHRSREQDESAANHEAARLERAGRLANWAQQCTELKVNPAAARAAADDEPELTRLVEVAAAGIVTELADTDADLRVRADAVARRLQELTEETERIRAARHVPPLVPATRTADRSRAVGAPLWELVDFAEHLPEDRRAGLEAALQASGMLDAWVGPDGAARIDGHDVLADPEALPPAPKRSLIDLLRPEPGGVVAADRVTALLSVVAAGDQLPASHPAAIGTDGTWRLGPTTGSWDKPEAQHIGATARSRSRKRRLAELATESRAAEAEREQVRADRAVVSDRRLTLDRDRAGLPARAELDRAHEQWQRAVAATELADAAVADHLALLTRVSTEAAARLRKLDDTAARTGLPTDIADLHQLTAAVEAFRGAATSWLSSVADLAAASRRAAETGAAAERSACTARDQRDAAAEAAERAEGLTHAVRTAEDAVDQSYREIVDRLADLRTAGDAAKKRLDATQKQEHAAELTTARLEAVSARAVAEQDAAILHRDDAGAWMRRVTAAPFGSDAGLDDDAEMTGDGVRATLETARGVATRWAATPHEPRLVVQALDRLRDELYRAREVLSARADLQLVPVEEHHHLLTASVDGVRTGAAGLAAALSDEAFRAHEDITESERALFETTLTGDTRRHLADRIRRAVALVDDMNARLDEVRTASDVAVRLDWQVDPELPASARAARELLLRNPAALGDDDRAALHRFFRDRVDAARARDDSISWEQQLAEVFDYTMWHRFVVRLDRGRGEGWQVLTKKLHGALSGGEKAIALHLPLFAAVAAHYESVPTAPRIILLDEVFVGVDETNRGQVFALLASLDLDLLLTSDHEWCAYRELDGIAVHQLVTGDGDDAVTTARFVWDGEDWRGEDDDEEQTGNDANDGDGDDRAG
ncbi:hypothetical protein AD006_30235 (plasmid) [Pseudonocardia sp. EC080610-09]|uniref:TIGR02680 family protein n=1 Tax=unclassified Pseudonocardia TaxID=2619320 RepID=UPI000705BB78|nr:MULTISPECIES: TIGR02680 family protein [unclassified Pseudonocardia]ALL79513.1 hypothetical protein AD006_30235 [Pseudonocardia sp. EC080610-09]ALL85535.1 hypothetical protein AD017_31015 [Pseudonocardia sp. EC080619-01]